MCSNIVIAMRFKDFQLTSSSTGINTEFKNTSSVISLLITDSCKHGVPIPVYHSTVLLFSLQTSQ